MKRFLFPLFSFLLVFSLLFTSIGTVNAAIGDDPVVTSVSGDAEFTTEVVPVPALPGTTLLASQMFVPVGFPIGEAQFEGNGIRVTGLSSGKATVCFTIPNAVLNQGWGGKVGVWNGTKWVLLGTSFSTADESPYTMACAAISGDGTYAFIKWVDHVELLPKCEAVTSEWGLSTDSDEGDEYFYAHLHNLVDGTEATLTFISADPLFDYYGFDGIDTALVGNYLEGDADFYGSTFSTEGPVLVTLKVTAGGCSKVMQITVGDELEIELPAFN
jgi:hypothetical protein